MDADTAHQFKELLRQDINWDHLLNVAHSHGVLPLLYWTLKHHGSEAVPKTIFDQLQNYFLNNARFNLTLTGELLRILNLFDHDGIPAIPFKGPILAHSGYGNIALREFVDLDLLIRKKDFLKVKEMLLAEGYFPIFKLNPHQERAFIRTQPEYHFQHKENGFQIEILWEFAPRAFSFRLNLEHLWERRECVSLSGKEILTLCPEDLLLILCVHGFKHGWSCLEWVCDIAEWVRSHKEKGINWDQLMGQAARLGCDKTLLLGLSLAIDLLGAVVPDDVLKKVKADLTVKSLAAKVVKQMFPDGDSSFGLLGRSLFRPNLEMSLFYLKLIKPLRKRVRYFYDLTIVPTHLEYGLIKLSPSFFFLYFLIRPLRLIGKYGIGALMR